MKILAIVGSLRAQSLNRQLAMYAKACCPEEVDFEILDYHDIPFMNQDIEDPAPAEVTRVRREVTAADGIWFFTPEYNHAVPGVLKNLLDWLSRPVNLTEPAVIAGKSAAFSGVSPGMSGTAIAQDQLVTLLSFLNVRIMNAPRLTIANAAGKMEGDKLILGNSLAYLEKQTAAFIEFLR